MKKILIAILCMGTLVTACNSGSNNQKASYGGEDISGVAEIIRDKNTKMASLKIDVQDNEPWKLYSGLTVDEISFTTPLVEGTGSGTYPLDVPDSVRSYFQLVTDKGRAILAERHLPMAGGFNFRDLGGIRTADGHYTKWGKIFRSDELHNLTQADLDYLASIPLITIVDFRSEQEIAAGPDKFPSSVHNYCEYTISPGNLTGSMSDISDLSGMNMDSIMQQINIMLVSDSNSIKRYRDFFELLQNKNDVPLMFHCTAGKDRTGMGAALVLSALGVDEETIIADYLSSNKYLADKYGKLTQQYPDLEPLFTVRPQYLQAGLDRIKADHGTVENYLRDILHVDIKKFKEMYLY